MNVFGTALARVAERVEGTRAVSLVGADGIPIETWGSPQSLTIETVAAEMSALLQAAKCGRSRPSRMVGSRSFRG
jgi:predicted regulator of Ras-like GTPase activity (Roadblock/LC7/MglB family)